MFAVLQQVVPTEKCSDVRHVSVQCRSDGCFSVCYNYSISGCLQLRQYIADVAEEVVMHLRQFAFMYEVSQRKYQRRVKFSVTE